MEQKGGLIQNTYTRVDETNSVSLALRGEGSGAHVL